MTGYTILIPAFNEAALIASTLRHLLQDGVPAGVRVVVICNGCTDDTGARARAASGGVGGVTVVELAEGGKAGAVNHGLDRAPPGPVFVMDADIAMRMAGFDRMAELLVADAADGVDAVSPVPHFVTGDSSAVVRRFFRVFARHPYLSRGVGGAGIWGVSARGRAKLGRLPPVIADDGYVRAVFAPDRQRRIALPRDIGPLVRTPRTDADLLRCEARWRSGDAELARLLPAAAANGGDARFRLRDALHLIRRNWADPVGVAHYLAIKLAGRMTRAGHRARGRHGLWHRDETGRAVAVPETMPATMPAEAGTRA